MAIAKGSGIVVVINQETNESQEFVSVNQAAKALGTNHTTLGSYIKNKKLFKKIYKVFIK
jgi:hypothetical protein